jgi:hypothetical protein
MKKFDTFKTLAQGVKSFVAMLLVTVMAVGSVIAQTSVTTTFSANGYENAQAVSSVVMDQNITLLFDAGTNTNAPKYYNSGTALRMYGGNYMDVVPAQGVTITGVEVTFGGSDGTNGITYSVDGTDMGTFTSPLASISATTGVRLTIGGTSGNRRFSAVTITYTTSSTPPAVTVAAPVITPATGTYMVAQNVTITSETAGANIYYTIDGTTPDANSTLYTAPIIVGTTTTVKAVAIVGTDASTVTSAVYSFPTIVANVAAFKTQTSTTEIFKINSDLTVIYQNAAKNATYVQDASGAIYIYGTTQEYHPGDVISGGVVGKYKDYNGLIELLPEGTDQWAAGTAGTPVAPVVATLAQIAADYSAYESKLVKVENVTFTQNKTFATTGSKENVNITQGDVTSGFQVRNDLKTLSTTVASGDVATVTGLVIRYINNNNTTIQIVPRSNDDIEFVVGPATLPLTVNFESGDAGSRGWVLDNGTATNKWYIGQAAGFDDSKLFVSNNGSTNKYDITTSSTAIAYRDVVIPATGAVLTFDYRVNGEGNYDYLKVDLVQNNTTTNIGKFSGSNDWATCNFVVPASMAGNARLQFTWVNDGNGGAQFPAAVDNVSMIETPCVQPTGLAAAVTGTNATITWTPGATTQSAWTFQYKLQDHTDWYTVNATSPTVNLTGLQGHSTYDMRVQANCGSDASAWTTGSFVVACQNEQVTVNIGNDTIGSGTLTDAFLPFYGLYEYSYTQQIFDAADIKSDDGNIYSISFYCSTPPTATGTTGNIKIWLANTNKTTFASTTDYVDPTTLTLVKEVSGVYDFPEAGWYTFTFNTPFVYTGGNLLVAYYEGMEGYKSMSFGAHSTDGVKALYHYNDSETAVSYSDPVNASASKFSKSVVNNIILNMDITTRVCHDQISCVAPDSLKITNITASGADLSWVATDANQTAYIVEYKKVDETTWTAQNVTGTTYTLTGLDQFSDYMVKVKANCGENDHSTNIEGTFTTIGNCPNITNLEYSNVSNTTTLTWNAGGSETEWKVQFKPVSAGDNEWVTINVNTVPMTTFGGLIGNTDYEARVKALCGTDSSQWVTVNFTSGCAPYNIPFVETFGAYSMPSCWTGEDFDFYSGYSRATVADAYMITPPINIPSAGTTYLTFEVEAAGAYTVLASYRGTRADRFAEIYSGQAGNRQVVVIPLPELYKGKSTNFKIVNGNGTQTFYNVKVNQCPFEPSNLNVSNMTETSLDLNWDANVLATNFEVQYGAKDFALGTGTTLTATTTTVNITGLTYGNYYDYYVRTLCGDVDGAWIGPLTVKQEIALIMGDQATAQACMGVLYDNGGPDGLYANSSDDVMTIYPNTPNSLVRLQGGYETESISYDYITIYDGENTNAPQLTKVGGTGTLDVTATNQAGALTVVFHSDNSVNESGFAFNISCEPAPTCSPVTDLLYHPSTSKLHWNEGVWGHAASHNVAYKLHSDTAYGTPINTTNYYEIELNMLLPNTTYDVMVQTVCSDNSVSDWSDPITITTGCRAMTLPYMDNFDSYAGATSTSSQPMPDCWQRSYTGTSTAYGAGVYLGSTYASSGENTLRLYNYYTTASTTATAYGDIYAVLPEMNGNLNTLEMSFDLKKNNSSAYYFSIFDVGVVTDITNFATSFVPVQSVYVTGTNAGELINVSFANYTGANGRIAFRMRENDIPTGYTYTYGYNYAFIDNLIVSTATTCVIPRISVSGYTATISYSGTNAPTFELRIGTETRQTTSTTVDLMQLFGLAYSTNYSVEVRAICGMNNESEWSLPATFTTPCAPMTLPYRENFDNYTGTTSQTTMPIPDCWNRMFTSTSTSYGAGIYNSSSYAVSGVNSLRLYNYYTTNTTTTSYGDVYAVLPKMDANISNLMVSFEAKKNTSTTSTYFSHVVVGVVTDPYDPLNTFTPVQSVDVTTASEQFDISLASYTGAAGNIAFRMGKNDHPSTFTGTYGYNYMYIDNLSVSAIPTCFVPSMTVQGATATITPNANGTTQSYELMIGSDVVPTTATTVDLMQLFPNLAFNTSYQVSVRAVCSATDKSDWSAPIDFTTPCDALPLPYSDNFDSYVTTTSMSTSIMPDCWHRMFTGTSTTYGVGLYQNTTYATSGENSLHLYAYYTTNTTSTAYGDAYAVLPKLSGNISNMMLSFDVKKYNTTSVNYFTKFDVGVVTDPYNPQASFTPIQDYLITNASEHIDLPLSTYTGANGYIAFRARKSDKPSTVTNTTGYNHTYIDNIVVDIIPTCGVPNLSVSGATATLSGGVIGTPQSYDLQIGQQTETVTGPTADLFTLFGLDLNTTYTVRARANCGSADGYSDWTDWVTFKTPACVGGASVEFDGTTAVAYLPTQGYYNYSYSQQIYLASEIGATNGGQISSLAFEVNTPKDNPRTLNVYLMHTTESSMPTGTLTTSSWLPITNAQLVFSGVVNFSVAGWHELQFTTPFDYNGTDNLLLIVDDNSGVCPNSGLNFKCQTTANRMTLYKYQDGSDIDPTAPAVAPSGTTYRNNVKFEVCPPVLCNAPGSVTVSDIHDTYATITWTANSNNAANSTYVLEYRAEGTSTWTVVPVNGLTHTITGLNATTEYTVRVKTDCGTDGESTYASASFTTPCLHGYYDENGLKVICPDANEMALIGMSNFKDACEIDGPVTVTVKNMGYDPITTFTASYILNDGTPVTETVTPATPLALLDEYTHTFATMPVFVSGTNAVKTWAMLGTVCTDTLTSKAFKLNPETVPYVEDFLSVDVNHGWNVTDVNNDGVTMDVTWGEIVYTYNDQAAANDWIMSPCVDLAPGTYTVAYDYAAKSVIPESFEVFYGTGAHIADMTTLLATHNINGTTVNHAKHTITITNAGTYNFGFHATSPAGGMGFSIDNFSVKPVIDVVVTSGADGTVSPMGTVQVPYGENLTLTIVPAPMYHVYGIWVDGTQVVPEDANGANLMLYTLTDVTAPHTIFVDYKLTFHIIKQAVNYRPDLYPNVNGGYFIPAATDTLLDNSPFTVYFAADNHYHFNKLELGVMTPNDLTNVTADVVDMGNGVYAYTLDTLRVANYYTIATFRKDTMNIHYNILTGKGFVDASDVLTAPAQYDTWIDYEGNHTSNIVPASGYYLVDVDGNGPVNTLTFNNVTTTQNVNVKFGFNVTAEVTNYYATNLGSNEIRGTITPTNKLVAEGDALTLTGTVQEHFHLESFLIDGVENIQNVTINNDGTFSYTFAEVHGNYHVNAIVKIDTFCITYNVAGGLAIIDNEATTTDPATRKICFNYLESWMSSFAPVAGYEITEITVDGVNYGFHDNFMFENISTNHVVNITVAPKTIVIDVNGYGNGTVSNDTVVSYDPTFVYNFTAVPATGHHIVSIMRNNEPVLVANPEAGYGEAMMNITESQTIVVYFAANEYVVTATTHNGGIITPAGATTYTYGATPVYTITPNAGYHISDVKVNGVSVGAVTSYTFPAITADQTIEAEFAANVYTVTVNTTTNGTITGPAASYSYGATPTYTITPATGYYIVDVTVDGQSVGAVSSYTFAPITGNHTIGATFAQLTYTINAVAGNGGSITPAGATVVNHGANQSYTITAATGYHIEGVYVDGVLAGTAGTYTFSNVTADHTISATFAANTLTVTVNQPQHGTIAPGTQTVVYGATPTFTITPNVGYTVASITLNGTNVMNNAVQVGNAYSYTLPAVTANATLTATMNAITYTIVASAGSNGSINPSGSATVNYGANATYTITPNAGYEIDKVYVDGINMGAVGTYTFVNVVQNHTINATFKQSVCDVPSNLYTINIDTTSATFTWYHAGAQSYDVRYKAQGGTTYTEATATTNLYNATGLQPNTTYAWQVRAHCAANLTSEWSNAMVFRTKAVPEIDHTGVENHVKDFVRVYASQNNVYITNDNGVRIDNVAIYDVYGKLIYTGKVNSNTEVISLNVAAGTYMVRLSTENGMANYKVLITK